MGFPFGLNSYEMALHLGGFSLEEAGRGQPSATLSFVATEFPAAITGLCKGRHGGGRSWGENTRVHAGRVYAMTVAYAIGLGMLFTVVGEVIV